MDNDLRDFIEEMHAALGFRVPSAELLRRTARLAGLYERYWEPDARQQARINTGRLTDISRGPGHDRPIP